MGRPPQFAPVMPDQGFDKLDGLVVHIPSASLGAVTGRRRLVRSGKLRQACFPTASFERAWQCAAFLPVELQLVALVVASSS